jgi:hypothetical protein
MTPNRVVSTDTITIRVTAPELDLAVGEHVWVARPYCYWRSRCRYEGVGEGVVTTLLLEHAALVRVTHGNDIEVGDRVLLPPAANSN